jgi:hypothetical protein
LQLLEPEIHLYTLCWNEEKILPFFLDHYRDLADRIIVYDNGSTDGSLDMLRGEPKVTLHHFDTPNDSFVFEELRLSETIWKQSRNKAGWVVMVDMDEFLVLPDFRQYLSDAKAKGITAVRAVGFDMVSQRFPTPTPNLPAQITRGFRAAANDKPCIFDPAAITSTNFTLGRHGANPEGRVVWPEKRELILLHYKTLGWDYYFSRTKFLATGLKPKDIEMGLGAHYLFSEQEHRKFFDRRWALSEPVPGLQGGPPASQLTFVEDTIHASGLFDEAWYMSKYPHLAGPGYVPISYYAFVGWRQDHNPNPNFNSLWYRNAHMGGAEANPLLHYIREGRARGLATCAP